LEPACVVVCPEHAILAGDLDDPRSEIARTISTQQVRVRKPEQGTRPKLFYVGAEESSIVPGLARQDGLLWATWPDAGQPGGNGHRPNGQNGNDYLAVGSSGHGHSLLQAEANPTATRAPARRSDWRGPIQPEVLGRMAGALLATAAAPRETYNVPHRIPWHWQVPSYLVTKAIGAGAFIVSAAGVALGLLPATPLFTSVASFLALVFIGLTTGFLVWDLDRPERFWTILIRPQWRSWLARGAFILIGFSGLAGLYWLGHVLGFGRLANWLIWPGVVLAVLSAVYTAFLFAQAEGRDLWQSTLLPWHLFVQAVMAGSAALLIAGALLGAPPAATRALAGVFGSSLLVNLLVTVGGEFGTPHASQVAAAAAHLITHGRYRGWYGFSLLAGLGLPLLLTGLAFVLPAAGPWLLAAAGLLALAGLFAYEWAFVMAPQDVPNN
jgi:formate-dependent nitrite reductase membrane component NrfD